MIDKFQTPPDFDSIDEFLLNTAYTNEYLEIVSKFFTENMELGGGNLLEAETQMNN